jgi:hypothetical protein
MAMVCHRHPLAAFRREKVQYWLHRRLSEPQGRSGQVWERKNFLHPPGFEPRTTLSGSIVARTLSIIFGDWGRVSFVRWLRNFIFMILKEFIVELKNEKYYQQTLLWISLVQVTGKTSQSCSNNQIFGLCFGHANGKVMFKLVKVTKDFHTCVHCIETTIACW